MVERRVVRTGSQARQGAGAFRARRLEELHVKALGEEVAHLHAEALALYR